MTLTRWVPGLEDEDDQEADDDDRGEPDQTEPTGLDESNFTGIADDDLRRILVAVMRHEVRLKQSGRDEIAAEFRLLKRQISDSWGGPVNDD